MAKPYHFQLECNSSFYEDRYSRSLLLVKRFFFDSWKNAIGQSLPAKAKITYKSRWPNPSSPTIIQVRQPNVIGDKHCIYSFPQVIQKKCCYNNPRVSPAAKGFPAKPYLRLEIDTSIDSSTYQTKIAVCFGASSKIDSHSSLLDE